MADDFPFRESNMPNNRATNGGQMPVKEIPYSKPPADVPMSQSPGIGGTNHGNCGTQGKH